MGKRKEKLETGERATRRRKVLKREVEETEGTGEKKWVNLMTSKYTRTLEFGV